MLPPVQSRWITQIVNDTKDVAGIVNRWITETLNTYVAASKKSLDNGKALGNHEIKEKKGNMLSPVIMSLDNEIE